MTIEIDALTKSFGKVKALDGMTFTVRPGELYGFVGSNGAGKTTTMRIMLGVLETDSGEVRMDGKPLVFSDRQRFGYMPEERGLYPKMKVADQLMYFARLHGLNAEQAQQNMEYWTARLGVERRRGDEVQTLSLGNQQRVQLAAALIHNPSVMVLDEPFSGLDPLAVSDMSDALREKANQGATIIFSSHQLDLVERICDRVGIASLGKIAAQGTIDELKDTGAESLEIVGEQPALVEQAVRGLGLFPRLENHAVRVQLPVGFDDQQVLHAALSVGAVHSFARVRPSLTDLFGSIVQVPPQPEPKPQKKGLLRRLFGGKND